MAASHQFSASPVPTYIIYRDVPEGQLYDPTATLAFFPPKDSDELFDALRAKYPHLKSHSERMRDATIEFLLEEREAEALSANVSPDMPSLYDSMNDSLNDNSPWQQSWPSATMTTLSSPDMTNFATPAFGNSPKPQIPHLVQQQSSAATPSTPAIDQMTSVFSLSTSEQPKQRVRRKMTEAEKVEYRKRRIVKACDKCSKRKRKCVHNQPAIEGLKSGADKPATHKVSKSRHNTTKQLPNAETTLDFSNFDASNALVGDGLISGYEDGGYEDFTLMFDDPTLDFSFDDFMPFDPLNFNTERDNYRQVQHSNADANGLPCDTRASRNSSSSDSSGNDSFANHTEGTILADNFVDLMIPHSSQIVNNPRSRDRYDLGRHQIETQQANHGPSFDAGQLEELGSPYPRGGDNLPQQPTHTAHTHEMQSPSSSALANSSSGGGRSSDGGLDRCTSDAVSLPVPSAGEQVQLNTTLRRSRKSAVNVARSPSGATPESNALRHRLRSAPALQSELSSTSVTSSGRISESRDAATLEGRPTASIDNRSSPQTSLDGDKMQSVLAARGSRPRSRPQRPAGPREPVSPRSGDTRHLARASAPLSSLQTRDSSAPLARPSPFVSTENGNARSTEIFRLKNRMPAWHDQSVPTANSTTASSGQSAQANGGAYPRLDTTRLATTTSSNALATQQQNRAEKAPLSTSIAKNKSNATEAAGARMLFTESETRREKDHHGRSTMLEAIAVVAKANLACTTVFIGLVMLAVVILALMLSSSRSHAPISILPVVLQTLAANNDSTRSRLSRVFTSSIQRKQQTTSSFGMLASLRLLGCV